MNTEVASSVQCSLPRCVLAADAGERTRHQDDLRVQIGQVVERATVLVQLHQSVDRRDLGGEILGVEHRVNRTGRRGSSWRRPLAVFEGQVRREN